MAEHLEARVDKFIFRVRVGYLYTEAGVWVDYHSARAVARVGLTDFRQQSSGDVAFVDLPSPGDVVAPGAGLANLETIKVDLIVPAPLDGEVVTVNEALGDAPELINQDPYGEGWLVELKPAASIVVDEIVAQKNLPQPQGLRRLTAESRPVVDALADAIVAEVDHLMKVRWSRSEGAILDAGPGAGTISTAACACGSGIPVTTVQVGERAVQIVALQPVLELAYQQGLRSNSGLPPAILQTVQVYNEVPEGEDVLWAVAVQLAWKAYCEERRDG